MTRQFLLLIASLLVLAGCSSSDSRYSLSDDTAPSEPISVEHIEDAIPQYEPYSLGATATTHFAASITQLFVMQKASLSQAKLRGMEKNSTDT